MNLLCRFRACIEPQPSLSWHDHPCRRVTSGESIIIMTNIQVLPMFSLHDATLDSGRDRRVTLTEHDDDDGDGDSRSAGQRSRARSRPPRDREAGQVETDRRRWDDSEEVQRKTRRDSGGCCACRSRGRAGAHSSIGQIHSGWITVLNAIYRLECCSSRALSDWQESDLWCYYMYVDD